MLLAYFVIMFLLFVILLVGGILGYVFRQQVRPFNSIHVYTFKMPHVYHSFSCQFQLRGLSMRLENVSQLCFSVMSKLHFESYMLFSLLLIKLIIHSRLSKCNTTRGSPWQVPLRFKLINLFPGGSLIFRKSRSISQFPTTLLVQDGKGQSL